MGVDVSWRFALAIPAFGGTVRRRDRGHGWPARLIPWQLAVLQMPFQSDDEAGEAAADVLWEAIWDAAEAQELEVAERVVNIEVTEDRVATILAREAARKKSKQVREELTSQGGVIGAVYRDVYAKLPDIDAGADVPPIYEEVEDPRHFIEPAAFHAWLTAQDMEPSQHIAAWFKVHGVAAGGQEAGAPATPAIAAQDVTDWPSLVRYRRQFADNKVFQRRPEWLPAHVALLAGQLQQECSAGHGRGALGRLAQELGAVRSTVGELLKKHDYSTTTGEKQQPPATAWSGLGSRGAKAA